jgi:AbrB family looped-hinge helix DNA binding protein
MNVTVSQKGWVVIPAILRKKYGLKPGEHMHMVDYGGVLALLPGFKDPIHEGAGMLQGDDSLTAEIVEEHRKDRELE